MFPFTDDIVNEWFERTFDEDVAEEKWFGTEIKEIE